MAKVRMIDTDLWDDEYVDSLAPHGKLVWIYLLTNIHTNIAGCYKITIKRINANTAVDIPEVLELLEKFEKDEKALYREGRILIRNFIEHQKLCNEKIYKGVINIIVDLPRWATDILAIDYPEVCIGLNRVPTIDTNSDSDEDLDSKSDSKKKMSLSAAETASDDDTPEDPLVAEFKESKPLREAICKSQGKKSRVPIITFDEWQTIKSLFEFWRTVFGKNAGTRLNVARGRAVLDRLRPPMSYSVEDVKKAIEGCKVSPFHSGSSGESNGQIFEDLELICRDDAHLERFIGHYDANSNGTGRTGSNSSAQTGLHGKKGERLDEIIDDSKRFTRPSFDDEPGH